MLKNFSDEKGFILTLAGAIIGLGNIWRFPYLVSNYGGGIFVALYLAILISIGYFLLLGELSLGKAMKQDMVSGINTIVERKETLSPTFWGRIVGGFGVTCSYLMSVVYAIVLGWILYFFVQNFLFLSNVTTEHITSQTYTSLTLNFETQLFWSFISIIAAIFFLKKDSLKSIEKLSCVFIPALFFILIYMILWVLTQSGAKEGALMVFKLDWQSVGFTANGFDAQRFFDVIVAALSQVIYSLSLGMGVIYIYGAYVPNKINIVSATKWIILLDTIFSILSAVFILSISSAYDIPKTSDTNLTFIALPIAFEQMLAGSFLMFLFYGIFFIAGLTTLISLCEPLCSYLSDRLHWPYAFSLLSIVTINVLSVMLVLLSSSNILQFKSMDINLFTSIDTLTNNMLLISVFLLSLFIGWSAFERVYQNIRRSSNPLSARGVKHMQIILKIIAPIIALLLFIHHIIQL